MPIIDFFSRVTNYIRSLSTPNMFTNHFHPVVPVIARRTYSNHRYYSPIPVYSAEQINTTGLTPEEIIVILYNAANPCGYGYAQFKNEPLSIEEAKRIWEENIQKGSMRIDYVHGRPLKIDLSSIANGYVDVGQYNEYNGANKAQKAMIMARQGESLQASEKELLANLKTVSLPWYEKQKLREDIEKLFNQPSQINRGPLR